MNPFYAPCVIDGVSRPPLVEAWPECRPRTGRDYLSVNDAGATWRNSQSDKITSFLQENEALALTFRSVLLACGKAAQKVERLVERKGLQGVLGLAALSGDDESLNELAHRIRMQEGK